MKVGLELLGSTGELLLDVDLGVLDILAEHLAESMYTVLESPDLPLATLEMLDGAHLFGEVGVGARVGGAQTLCGTLVLLTREMRSVEALLGEALLACLTVDAAVGASGTGWRHDSSLGLHATGRRRGGRGIGAIGGGGVIVAVVIAAPFFDERAVCKLALKLLVDTLEDRVEVRQGLRAAIEGQQVVVELLQISASSEKSVSATESWYRGSGRVRAGTHCL